MKSRAVIWTFLAVLTLLVSCSKDVPRRGASTPGLLTVPEGFPEIPFPEDNRFSVVRWELGKRLFYDPVLSRDSTVSCASCHLPEYAFSDVVAFSKGVDNALGTRNAPSLANVAYLPYFTREGGVPTLEMQILVPIQEHNEFDFNIVDAAERLRSIHAYMELSWSAYKRDPDPYVITRAIATFERTLISGNSAYDQYKYQNDPAALSALEIEGMELFFSERTQCSACHSGFNFTNSSFENNGLYKVYADSGRMRLTGNESDRALFKVPSLRNAELTAPYMHDGSINSLRQVVEHYNSGGKDYALKSDLIRPLELNQEEIDALVAFLESLTDHMFISNPQLKF